MNQASDFPYHTKVSKFFEELNKGKLVSTRCRICKRVYFPPRADCIYCMKSDMEWTKVGGNAELITYTIVHIAPERWKNFTPFIVAIGKLDEGPNFMAVLENIDVKDVEIGMRLRLVPSERPIGYPEPSYKYKFVPFIG